jgi:phosphohistidine phosphatase
MAVIPDAMISSPAKRAFTTASVVASKLGIHQSNIIKDEIIYGGDAEELLDVIKQLDDRYDHVFLFGHNPGFHDLANTLLRNRIIEKLVTCGVVRIKLEVESWSETQPASAKLIEYLYPKLYK